MTISQKFDSERFNGPACLLPSVGIGKPVVLVPLHDVVAPPIAISELAHDAPANKPVRHNHADDWERSVSKNPRRHSLRVSPEPFAAIITGHKRSAMRSFPTLKEYPIKIGDLVHFDEVKEEAPGFVFHETGRTQLAAVTYVEIDQRERFGIPTGYMMFSFALMGECVDRK